LPCTVPYNPQNNPIFKMLVHILWIRTLNFKQPGLSPQLKGIPLSAIQIWCSSHLVMLHLTAMYFSTSLLRYQMENIFVMAKRNTHLWGCHPEHAQSHLISKAKWGWACLVLGWEKHTKWSNISFLFPSAFPLISLL
jgi:hypothetical protein